MTFRQSLLSTILIQNVMAKDLKRIPNFDEIVFEIRNKEYGAYIIRKKYKSTLSVALGIGIIIIATAIITPYLNAKAASSKERRAIGGLNPCETRQDGALAGSGCAEQSEALAGPQTDANVDREGAPRFDYVRIKHWRCVFAQADERAMAAGARSVGIPPATA
jgi:hypothetical protein